MSDVGGPSDRCFVFRQQDFLFIQSKINVGVHLGVGG